MSGQSMTKIHAHELYGIMFQMSTSDVMRCMQICLSDEHFWREFVHRKFDLSVNPDLLEGPLECWATNDWCMYFGGWEDDEDYYHPMRPLPSTWNCGVVVPSDFDVTSLDLKHLQGLSRSLEILTKIRKAKNEYAYLCGFECSTNESDMGHGIAVFLVPWDKDGVPDKRTLFSDIFHFHPAVWEHGLDSYIQESEDEPLFHINSGHTGKDKMCLNATFGRPWDPTFGRPLVHDKQEEIEFGSWLQKIMVSSKRYRSGENKLNPIVHFLITALAPGWVGGALTGETWT